MAKSDDKPKAKKASKPAGSGQSSTGVIGPVTGIAGEWRRGRINFFVIEEDRLTLKLRGVPNRVYALENNKASYASVLATLIAAQHQDQEIVVETNLMPMPGSALRIKAVGFGSAVAAEQAMSGS